MAVKLSGDQVKQLRQSLRSLHDVLPDLDKGEKCGIDCSEHRAVVEKLRTQIEAILHHFGSDAR